MAAAMLDRAGGEWPPNEREQYDETLSTITAGLPPDVLTRALAQGAAMSLPDGVAYAGCAATGKAVGRFFFVVHTWARIAMRYTCGREGSVMCTPVAFLALHWAGGMALVLSQCSVV